MLGEAENPDVPLLERVKFLSICAHNLDEFFMIRVGEIRDLIAANVAADPRGNGLKRLQAVRSGARSLLREIYRCLGEELIPALRKEGIRIERVADLGKKERNFVEEYFCRDLEPILTPLAIDPAHPFPFIANLSLNLALQLESERGERHVAIIKIPESVPRLVPMPEKTRFVLLEDVISSHVHRFFPRPEGAPLGGVPRHPQLRSRHQRRGHAGPPQEHRDRAAAPRAARSGLAGDRGRGR